MENAIQGFRLSPHQRQICLLPASAGPFVAQCAMVLEGSLDPERLRRALEQVVARHEILRTTFQRAPGVKIPIQVIADRGTVEWRQEEAEGFSEEGEEGIAEALLERDRQEGFDVERGPLLRACLVPVSRGHLLAITASALCADAHTLTSLARELAQHYSGGAELDGEEELVQYVQFSEWQNELLEESETGQAKEWGQRFEDLPAPHLAFEGKRSSDLHEIPDSLGFEIGPEVASGLKTLAETSGAPLPEVLLAAWQTLLWRLTDTPEVLTACSFACRSYEELEGVLGPFSKYLPVACHIERGDPFTKVLEGIGKRVEEARQWQDYYIAEIDGDVRQRGMFEVGFDFESLPETSSGGGVSFSFLRNAARFHPFRLQLACCARGESLRIELLFDRKRFRRKDVAGTAEQFKLLLRRISEDPSSPVEALDILTEEERQDLLVAFNATAREMPQVCLHQLFTAQQERTPEAVAVAVGKEVLTYAELEGRSNRLAHRLRKLGVGPEVVVAVCMERSFDLVTTFLAVLKAGGAYVPLEPWLPPERLKVYLEDTGAPVIVTHRKLAEDLPPSDATILTVDGKDLAGEGAESDAAPSCAVTPDNLAYLLYTSGSTGRPKAVMVPHRGLVNYLLWSAEQYGIADGNGAIVHSPISFDLTVTALFAPLLRGQRLVMVPEVQGIEGLTTTLAEGSDFSLVKLTPSHLQVVNQLLGKHQLAGRIRTLVVGGEALAASALAPWRLHAPDTRIVNEYGPTETIVGSTYFEVLVDEELPEVIPIGRPIANTRVYLLDERMQPVSLGVAGSLHVAGAGVTRGYLARPAVTARTFIPNPFAAGPGGRLYRTGDRARFRHDGALEFLGREDFQVKIRGIRVEPGEIEACLLEHPAIAEAVAVARADDLGELRLVAYLVGHDGEVPSAGEMRRFLQQKLPEAMIPTLFTSLASLPLTAHGKVDRSALPAPGVGMTDLNVTYVAPRSAVEEVLAAIWAQILGVERVGIDDNFFSLGGDSLRSVRAVALAKERGLFASVEQLFEHQTIREMAPIIRTTETALPPVQTRPFSLVSEADRGKLPEGLEDAYPLTTMQAGMLYHMQLNPDRPAYHNVNTWHLRAPFDWEIFLEAVERVVARHPVLRTHFDLVNYSEPLQLVWQECELPVNLEDLRSLDPAAQRLALEAFWERECRAIFDLSRAPYLRLHIHRRTDTTYQFTLTESHAVVDGWSTTSTLAELFEVFLNLLQKRTSRIERPMATSFREYVFMEQEALRSEESRRFWTEKLQGAESTRFLRWPGYPRSDVDTDYRKVFFDFPPESIEGVRRVAHSVAVPLKTALLASHLKVMSLVSGRPEVLTGIISNGRPEQLDGDRIRGLFLNTVPVRMKLKPGTWIELIRDTFDTEREMMPHRRYPISAMQKQWGSQPIFETTFNYLNFHSVENLLRSGELEVREDDEKDFSFTNFTLDISYFLSPVTSNVRLIMEYDGMQLADPQALRLIGYYVKVIEAMAADHTADHQALSLLSPGELHLQQVEWNDTQAPPAKDRTVPTLIAEQAAKTPEAMAVMGGGEELTYRDLHLRSNQLAQYLRAKGAGPESLVGLCMGRSVDMVVALLGVLKSGAAYLPLDPTYPEGRLRHMLEDGAVELVITQEALRSTLPSECAQLVLLDREADAIAAQCTDDLEAAASLGNPAYVIYTSGSTGRPKGVVVSHQALGNFTLAAIEHYRLEPTDRMLQFASISFDTSVEEIFPVLVQGGTLILRDDAMLASPTEFFDRCREWQLSVLDLPTAYWHELTARLEGTNVELPPSLRLVILGGERALAEPAERWLRTTGPAVRLVNSYGPTETTVVATAADLTLEEVALGLVPIGRPIANYRVHLLDASFRAIPIGVGGNLLIGGECLARGYLNQPALTAERFTPDPFSPVPGQRLYRTGDVARWLPYGELEFLGRADQQVKIRGFRIELGEIEAVLSEHPAVGEVCALLREDISGAERLAAYVVPLPGQEVKVSELRELLRRNLPSYMMPSAFVMLESLPKTVSGKVDRDALPALGSDRPELEEAFKAPNNPLEESIAVIWQEVLAVERVGIHDNFFDLGGDSLRLMRAYNQIRSVVEHDFPLISLFNHPTVESLAHYLSRAGEEQPVAVQQSEKRRDLLKAGGVRFQQQREKMRRLR